jgi:hypothetical protein
LHRKRPITDPNVGPITGPVREQSLKNLFTFNSIGYIKTGI